MTTYSFAGKISLGKGVQPFEREIEAESEKHAEDKLYSQLCSEHSVNRSRVEIEESGEV
ncbi:MAG: 50S ribosomal protein L18Ae [Candidatus Nanohaloarchaea archaeon]